MDKRMSVTAACNAAAKRIPLYRQGTGWISGAYDPMVDCVRLTEERPYSHAARYAMRARYDYACWLLGMDVRELPDPIGRWQNAVAEAVRQLPQ